MKKLIWLMVLLFLLPGSAMPQYFGKNKVQYGKFNWQYLQTEHFDIYFTEGGQSVATFVGQVAEESYQKLRQSFRYDLQDRIKVIVHNSHNDFQQTNVDLSEPEESVGGFTEFFKNRVVIPYEGEWEKFRHVVHHELTHAVMLQMVYGAGVQSIITGLTQMQLPLWFIEGLAEYESRGWDIESDMYMRDATLNGYVPEVPMLYGFLAYKGGQSVWNYVTERYGAEKVGELIGKVKINKSFERGLKNSIGIDEKELTKRWHLYLKRKYWPDIENRKEPEEIAKRLTDHRKDGSFVNISPAFSHRGDKLVFKSDKSDYFDIYLMSAIDGRVLKSLVRGQRAGNLEELQWLRGPGMSWSPDDKRIVFTAKAGAQDAIYIVNVKSGKMEKDIRLGLDGIYNPAWSPDGNEIAFMGLKNGQSDLYSYDLKQKRLRKITDDVFSDAEPSWSPDGKHLVFISDRGDFSGPVPERFSPRQLNMKNFDIFQVSSDGREMSRLVQSDFIERTPVYSPDGKFLAFSSERSGVSNIYLKRIEDGQEYPITNVLTGAFQPSWGGTERLAFTSFYFAGYDLYLMKNPQDIKPGEVMVEETNFVKNLREGKNPALDAELLAEEHQSDKEKEKTESEKQAYRSFIFDEAFAKGDIKPLQDLKKVTLDSTEYALPSGEFKINKYKVKLSPDLVYGSVGYSQFFGSQGLTNIMLSDVMGDHRLNIAVGLYGDFRNADYGLTYFYLPHRLDVGTGFYHNAYYFYSDYFGWVRDRNYGLSALLSNPLNKFERIDFGLTAMGISRSYLNQPDSLVDLAIDYGILSPRDRYFLLNSLSYTKDTSIWGSTGPINGSGMSFGATYSPGLGKNGIDFATFRGDWRRYMRLVRDYTLVLRLAGGFSEGKNKQKFFLGGVPNWLNNYFYGDLRVEHIEDIYFASFEMPLRGADYYSLEGNRFFMTNFEFRFPLIRHLLMGFPLPIGFYNIGGAIFSDIGVAWDKGDAIKNVLTIDQSKLLTQHLFMSYGFGVRLNLGFLLLRFDLAWPTNFHRSASSPQVLWSLGADL